LNTPGQVSIEYCANGLVDGATPIIIRGNHLANLFSGQVFFDPPDLERFRKQADLYGYDIKAYLKAVKEVPVVSESDFKKMLKFLSKLAITIAPLGIKQLEFQTKVKILSGLLPMCSACKKIRDDKGYWNQIEKYIRDHSEAEFSHSLCPECSKKLYPDLCMDE